MERRSSITITVSDPKQSDEEVISQSDVRELRTSPQSEHEAVTVRQPPPLQSVRVARAHKLEAGGLHEPDEDEATPSIKKTLLGASVPPAMRAQVIHPPRNLHPATPPPNWEPHLSSDEVALLRDQVARLSQERAKRSRQLLGAALTALVVALGAGFVLGTNTTPKAVPPSDTAKLEAELQLKNQELATTLAERDALRAATRSQPIKPAATLAAPLTESASVAAPSKSSSSSAKASEPGVKLAQNVAEPRAKGPALVAAQAQASSVSPSAAKSRGSTRNPELEATAEEDGTSEDSSPSSAEATQKTSSSKPTEAESEAARGTEETTRERDVTSSPSDEPQPTSPSATAQEVVSDEETP